ncbi:MAG: hypothetical protein WAU01_01125 [Saprospiraceae bacterium]
MLISQGMDAQMEANYKNLTSVSGSNYYTIQKEVKKQLIYRYLNASGVIEKKQMHEALNQFGRWSHYWRDYVNADGTFPALYPEFELLDLKPNQPINTKALEKGNLLSALSWTQVGPVGRVNAHGYDAYPGNGRVNVARKLGPGTYIIGTPNGGIWKTTNNGVNWEPKLDVLARIGITDIRVNPTNPNIMYAMTGDRDAQNTSPIGIIKSIDAGETWSTTGLLTNPAVNEGFYNSSIGMKPSDPNKLVAVVNDTVYYTHDGAITFLKSNINIPTGSDILYTEKFILISDLTGGIFLSKNDGVTFENIYDNAEGEENIVIRFNQDVINNKVYFLAAIPNAAKIYTVTLDMLAAASGAAPIAPVKVGNNITDFDPQGVYNVTLAVNPFNVNKILVCSTAGMYSSNGGNTWARKVDDRQADPSTELYVHPDHHFSHYIDENTILDTHDGGISLINTASQPFGQTDLSGNLIIGQIYHFAINPSDDNKQNFMLGLQDNDGYSKSPNTLSGQWVAAQAGDGTAAAINYNNPNIRFLGGTTGTLYRTTSAYRANYMDAVTVIEGDMDAPFVCEAVIHNQNPNHVFAGHLELKYSTDGGASFKDAPSSMEVGPTLEIEQYDTRIALVGDTDQKIATYKDGVFSNVKDITPPQGIMTNFNSISLATTKSDIMYGSISGYDQGKKVFKSLNNGLTWTNISGDLPNVVVKKIISKVTNLGTYDEILFAATNIGVYYKLGSTSLHWSKLGDNLPFTEVTDLIINYVTDKLYASTFGRGLWEIDIKVAGLSDTKDAANILPDIALSPNPTPMSQDLYITLPKEINQVSYSVFNYVGGLVKKGIIAQDKDIIPTEGLSTGRYLIVFDHDGQTISKTIIII